MKRILRHTLIALLLTTLPSTAPAVEPAPAAAVATPLADQPAVSDAVELLDLWIREQMSWRQVPGLAIGVVHDQEVVWMEGYGVADLASGEAVTPATRFRLGSLTKLFTATAILQLRDAGDLRLDDPVTKYLPWFRVQNPFPGSPPLTIQHLLTHTAGLPREAALPYWTTHQFPSLAEIRRVLPEQELLHPPGTTYRYSNLGMALLGAVVEAAAGRPYARYLDEEIFTPLGMEDTTLDPTPAEIERLAASYMRRQPDGSRRVHTYYPTRAMAPAANLISSLADLTRFAALQFADGPAGRVQILAGNTLAEMHRPHFVYDDWSGGRGLGWGAYHPEDTTFVAHGGWIGGHRSHLLLVPEEEIAVIALVNAADASPSLFTYQAYETVGQAIRAVTREREPEPRPRPEWRQWLGTYTDPWGWEYEVLIHDGRLTMYEHAYPPRESPAANLTPLEPTGEPTEEHSFRMPDGGRVVFELDEAGRVERIQRRYDYLFPVESFDPDTYLEGLP